MSGGIGMAGPYDETWAIHTAEQELETDSGLVMASPDQGVPYIAVILRTPGILLPVWWTFPSDRNRGHNIEGFTARMMQWYASDEPYLVTHEPREGHIQVFPRSLIPEIASWRIERLTVKDNRAAERLEAKPEPYRLRRGNELHISTVPILGG
jgi:hypothetical protein